uniref:Ig-like domain-containing protein n=2 Tax=Clastoptera arizonana TaxID=38151 RepID=A0A1B6ED55_9HEMI
MIWIQNQLVGVKESHQITLECHSEAYPRSINYWTREKGDIISHGAKYEPELIDNAYKVHMKLTIKSVNISDFGTYKCVSKNSLGDTDGSIRLYQIPNPTTTISTIETTQPSILIGKDQHVAQKPKYRTPKPTYTTRNDIARITQDADHNYEHKSKGNELNSNTGELTTDHSSSKDYSAPHLAHMCYAVMLFIIEQNL